MICNNQKLKLPKGPSSYTKSDIMLKLGSLEYTFPPAMETRVGKEIYETTRISEE